MRLRRALLVVLALIAVVLGLAVLSGFQLYSGALSDQEQQSLENTAEKTASQIDGLIAERAGTVELQAADPAVLDAGEQRQETLRRFVETTQFQGISVITADGEMVAIESRGLTDADEAEVIGADFSDRTYFQRAMDGETYVSEPVEAETGNHIVTISTPVEQNGETVATLHGALHVGEGSFFETLLTAEDIDHTIQITAGDEVLYDTGEFEKRNHATASADVAATGWEVTAAQTTAGTDETQVATILQIGAGAIVLVTLVGFSLWFQRSNLRQIEELLAGFDRLADREYGTTIAVGGAQEWDEIESRFNDVSAELAAHERELKRYREIVERIDDPIRLQDRDGSILLANQAVSEYTGYSQEELLGADESLFMDESAAERAASKRTETEEDEQPVEYEVSPRFQRTGEEPTFSTRSYPYYDETGELAGTVSVCRDITSLKRRETELRQYKRAIEGATDLICAVDEDRNYLFANPQYCRYHDVDEDELQGLPTSEMFDEETYEEINQHTERALNGERVKYKMTRNHPTRGKRILDVRYYPLRNDGTVTGFVSVLRDVTQREERARQLRVVDRVLRHNLRNDLTVIQLEAERISAIADDEIAEAADVILDHTDTLLTTSDKSRSITEVLSEQPERRTVDLSETVANVCTGVEREYPAASLDWTTPATAPAWATDYLHEALLELVTNAIVHSDRERPSVEVTVEERDQTVLISVADDGPGVPEMDRDVLESGRAIEDLYHGSGLGLWMVYWIVQRSGGSITVEDRTPTGTIIEISLTKKEN